MVSVVLPGLELGDCLFNRDQVAACSLVGFGIEKKLVLVLLTPWSSVKLGGFTVKPMKLEFSSDSTGSADLISIHSIESRVAKFWRGV
jgi:hypothetical protein